ncbi:stage V sporulation protein AF [Desulfohalotomaculum tongense]|uniref:spore germination protein n=1 Tax=Desulforadius tongensis TaxID=1216062 RepID=UPI001A9C4A7C|nr:spore germination protein [Desulforadius tongensis]MBM7854690.1 stage V sporulation protein AF [Desulforadius tongensis]
MGKVTIPDEAKLTKHIDKNIDTLNEALGVGKSYDLICRKMTIAGKKKIALYYVNGMVKEDIMTMILHNLDELDRQDISVHTLEKLLNEHINHIQVQKESKLTTIINNVMSGPLALVIDGEDQALVIDVRNYPGRQPQEPDLEKVVRGSRDGFVETVLLNTALLRRRIRDPRLRFEVMQSSIRSKTDIIIAYIEDVANEETVERIKERIKSINIDGLPMAEKAVEELITPGSYWNPFPKVRYTERPDVAAAHLLEGRVLVMVDTSPSVIIAPVTLWDHMQHAEEFRQNPAVGVYVRWARYLGIFTSIFLLPVWLLFALQPELLPPDLRFIGPNEPGKIPLIGQFLIAEVAVDWIRMAAIHTPTPLATSLGIIAALLIGDMATQVGLFTAEVIMYTAVSMVGVFLTPSFELSWANRLVRLFLLLAVAIFRLPGLIIATLAVFAYLANTKSFGVPYLWPVIPLNFQYLKTIFVRTPVSMQNTRPSILKPKEAIRQGTNQAAPEPARKPEERKKRK